MKNDDKNISFPSDFVEKLKEFTKSLGTNPSEFIQKTVLDRIDQIEKEKALKAVLYTMEEVKDSNKTYITPESLNVKFIGTILVNFRSEHQLTQVQLAKHSNLSRQTIARIEEEKTSTVNRDTLRKLASGMNIILNEKLGPKEDSE